ncbi:MAG: ABC transporter substrate-binding protein [Proteobacteria bacterium]|nr:ABC transporter substrate-binding protein [Pseudomonadota bacterium]
MPTMSRRQALALPLAATLARPAIAQTKQSPGVTDTEILIGQTMPYSGPASSYGTIGKSEAAYFNMVNEQGGVNGRKIKFLSLDDGYVPPKTVEQTRRLVEQDEVAALFSSLGTPTNNATRKYLNEHKVPTLFVATGATQFGDHEKYPWTMGWQPSYQIEGRAYGKYILATKPDAKVAVLYQNDDSGKDYLKGIKDGLGAAVGKMLVGTASYEVTDPTVDSQVAQLQSTGADTLFVTGIPKYNAMAMRRVYDIGWHPTFFISSTGSSVATAMIPAGPEKCVGVMTVAYLKDPTDKQWATDEGFKGWLDFMQKYYPDGDKADINNAYGYSIAQTMVQVLKQAGNDLSRPNLMKQATNLNLVQPLLQPGIRITTSPTDYYPIKQVRLVRFDGKAWVPFGDVISG